MRKQFSEALADLINEYLDLEFTADQIISDIEIQLIGLKEEAREDR